MTLGLDGVTLSSRGPAGSFGGVIFESGSAGVLNGAVIDGPLVADASASGADRIALSFGETATVSQGTTWTLDAVDADFGGSAQLKVRGTLTADDVTFAASSLTAPWSGVRVQNGGNATFSNQSLIDRGGVTVTNGTFTLDDSVLREAGVYATGSSSYAYIQNESRIESSGSYGAYALNGADIFIRNGAKINQAGSPGARSRGAGSLISIDGSTIFQAKQYGLIADYYGDVEFGTSFGPVDIDDSPGSMQFETASSFLSQATHRIRKTPGSSGLDVFTMDGAYVDADNNFWGQGVTSSADLNLFDDPSATLIIDPVSTVDPFSSPALVPVMGPQSTPDRYASTSRVARDGAEQRAEVLSEGGPFVSALGLDTVRGWVEASAHAYRRGDVPEAVRAAALAVDLAVTDTDRRMAWAAASRLAIRIQSSRDSDGSATWKQLERVAATWLSDRDHAPWVLRTLALGEAMSVQPGAHGRARAHIASLLGTEGASHEVPLGTGGLTALSHAGFGQLLLLRLAIDEGDQDGALAASVALAGLDSEQAEIAAIEVEATFPSSSARHVVAARIGEANRAALRADVETTEAALAFAVAPNPSSRPQLSYSLTSFAEVQITVFDELGRQGAVVNETGSAGRYTARLDLGGLPSGVYLARLAVRPGAGSETISETRRFTVIR